MEKTYSLMLLTTLNCISIFCMDLKITSLGPVKLGESQKIIQLMALYPIFIKTAFRDAAMAGDDDAVTEIIKSHPELIKSEIFKQDDDGNTLLHYAAQKGYTCVAHALLEAQAKLGRSPDPFDSFFAPSDFFNIQNKGGKTAAQLAIENNHADIADRIAREIEIDGLCTICQDRITKII